MATTNKSATSKIIVDAFRKLDLDFDRDDMTWISAVGSDDEPCMIHVKPVEEVLHVMAVVRAGRVKTPAAIWMFLVSMNSTLRFTHFEYDPEGAEFRCIGQAVFGNGGLSVAMVSGLISRCVNGMGDVVDSLHAVASGKLTPERAMEKLEHDHEEEGEAETDEGGLASSGTHAVAQDHDGISLDDDEDDYWEKKASPEVVREIGLLLKVIKERLPGLASMSTKSYISIAPCGEQRCTDVILHPQKKAIVFSIRLPETAGATKALQAAGAVPMAFDEAARRMRFSLPLGRMQYAEDVLLKLIGQALNAEPSKGWGAQDEGSTNPKEKATFNIERGLAMNTGAENQEQSEMRLTSVLVEWLEENEWDERPEVGEDGTTSSLGYVIGIDNFSLKCIVEIDEEEEFFKLYMYYADNKVPTKAMEEVKNLIIEMNLQLKQGHIDLSMDDRIIRYVDAIRVTGAAFEPAHITNMKDWGDERMQEFMPMFMAVCFGGKTAQEVLEGVE